MLSQIHLVLCQRITIGSKKRDFWIAFNAYVHLDTQFISQLQLVAKILNIQRCIFLTKKIHLREQLWRIPLRVVIRNTSLKVTLKCKSVLKNLESGFFVSLTSSHDFLSVIFGIFGEFWIDLQYLLDKMGSHFVPNCKDFDQNFPFYRIPILSKT